MNRLLTTLVLILSTSILLQAQDGYVKFNTDSTFLDNTVRVFKGEIVPFGVAKDPNKINLQIDNVLIPNVTRPSKNFIEISPNKEYLSDKEKLVQLKKGNIVYVNVESISSRDNVRLISENGIQLAELKENHTAEIKKSKCGETFRLIITNTPTIYYNTKDLKELKENWPWWCYFILVIVAFAIGIVIWILFFKKNIKTAKVPKYKSFNDNSLDKFASRHDLSIRELIKLNKGLIPKNYEKLSERDKKDVKKDLREKNLIIGYQNASDQENHNALNDLKSTETIQPISETTNAQESDLQSSSQGYTDNIPQLLNRIEKNIINEIQRTTSRSNDNSNEMNRMKTEISNLKSENKQFKTNNQNLDSTISQLKNDKEILDKNIILLKEDKDQKILEIKQLHEIVIIPNFLSGYCESVLAYFKLCNEVTNDAYSYFNRISQQDIQQASVLGHLLTKYQISINAIPVGNWIQIIQDINDTGATTNKKLIRSFSQIQSEEEKKREFQRLLFSDVLIKYSSSILILAEEFRNLVHFQIPTELANEVQAIFSKHVSELNIKIKSTGLENKYVPLFQNFEKFLGNIESVGRERNFAYREVHGLEKGSIAEIISYGIKTSFEDTKTLIILA